MTGHVGGHNRNSPAGGYSTVKKIATQKVWGYGYTAQAPKVGEEEMGEREARLWVLSAGVEREVRSGWLLLEGRCWLRWRRGSRSNRGMIAWLRAQVGRIRRGIV